MENKVGRALNANVIVLETEVRNETESGLDISSQVDKNEKYREGTVVSLGNLCPKGDDGELLVKIGDKVSFDKYKTTEYTKNAVTYKIVHFADLLLVD